jgi:Mlc titration factor MtfA (ptsG expression regulator)
MFGKLVRWLRDAVAIEPTVADKRAAIRATPFPDAWRAIIEREVPHYRRLDEAQRAKLLGDIQVFIAEKTIVGLDGFEVHDRARVLIAAGVALLVLGRDLALLDHVSRVIILPDDFDHQTKRLAGRYEGHQHVRGDEVVGLGGEVELAWTHVETAFGKLDGNHVTVHEFAHALDHGDGEIDALTRHTHYDRWRARLRDLPMATRRWGPFKFTTEVLGDVDPPGELFAYATELFFETPRRLYRLDAELFAALVEIYGIDPRTLVDH